MKTDNPPNAPQLRPIEHFWSFLKQKVYENDWKAENTEQLLRRIRDKAKLFSQNQCNRLFACLKTKIRNAADNGLKTIT